MSTENAWYMVDKLREILKSDCFDKDSFDERRLKLSQAFCLLWQDKESGEVAGRQKSGPTASAAIVTVLIDLLILGKIEFEAEMKQWMTRRREIIYVKAIDTTPCGTFLDKALFSNILSHQEENPDKPKTVNEWLIEGCSTFPTCATEILESLIDMEILGRKDVLFWRKFPTKNPEPEKELVDEIRGIALSGHPVDGYMWTLLKLMRDVDACAFRKGTFLPKYFTEDELGEAIACINKLTHVEEERRIENKEFVALQEMNGEKSDEASCSKEESSAEHTEEACQLEDVRVEEKEDKPTESEMPDSPVENAIDKDAAKEDIISSEKNDDESIPTETSTKKAKSTPQTEEKPQSSEDDVTREQENVNTDKDENEKMEKEDDKREEKEEEGKQEGEKITTNSEEPEKFELDKNTLMGMQSNDLNTKM